MTTIVKADTFTLRQKEVIRYSDFLDTFETNPVTGQLARVVNEDAVKQSLKNLILTECGERFYDSNKGSRVRQSLFELFDVGGVDLLKIQLQQSAATYEPRAQIIEVDASRSNIDANLLFLRVIFSVINIPNRDFTLSLNVTRVR